MPRWLVTAAVAVLVANPIVFVIGIMTTQLFWIYASIGLAIVAAPAIVVVGIALFLWLLATRQREAG